MKLYETDAFMETLGVVRLEVGDDGLQLWVGGKCRYNSDKGGDISPLLARSCVWENKDNGRVFMYKDQDPNIMTYYRDLGPWRKL